MECLNTHDFPVENFSSTPDSCISNINKIYHQPSKFDLNKLKEFTTNIEASNNPAAYPILKKSEMKISISIASSFAYNSIWNAKKTTNYETF
jgi:hypothetical protein